jgi:hypothetical protein
MGTVAYSPRLKTNCIPVTSHESVTSIPLDSSEVSLPDRIVLSPYQHWSQYPSAVSGRC